MLLSVVKKGKRNVIEIESKCGKDEYIYIYMDMDEFMPMIKLIKEEKDSFLYLRMFCKMLLCWNVIRK